MYTQKIDNVAVLPALAMDFVLEEFIRNYIVMEVDIYI